MAADSLASSATEIDGNDSLIVDELCKNFENAPRSITVELKDEDSYVIVPENLTFAEITNILNRAIKESNYEELDKVVQNIEDYEGQSIALDGGSFKNLCSNQLNLDLQNRSNHQHIYSNILSQYNFDQVEFKCNYSVKELALLAIAANDQLADRYQGVLFAEGNLNLLPLLVGGQKYIEAFIKKFHDVNWVYDKLKNQVIQLIEPNRIGFFLAIALRKEQNLLDTVFVEYVLKDLEQVLKTSGPDSTYGVLETASLVQNEEFITIVLGAFERYIDEPTKKASTEELLKKSFATLLETAISQEHVSVVECLCKKCTKNKGPVIQGIYKEAFADNRVIEQLNKQIIKKIISGGTNGSRKEKAEKIYDLVLKAALDVGNVAFIEHLCEKCTKCSNDVIDYLDQKLKDNEFDNTYESTLVALSNIGNEGTIVTVLTHIQIYQNVPHNEQVIRQVIQNILKSAIHYSMDQEDYSLVKKVCYLFTEIDAVNVIFQEECKNFKSSIEKRIEGLKKENRLLQSKVLREYNCSYFPDIINGVAQIVHTAYDAYTEDQKPNEYRENVYSILSLMHIRDILQFSIDVQEYRCYERQDLWDAMYKTPGTFIIRKRSDNVADKLAISVIKSNILSEDPEPKSIGNQQPQKNVVDKRKNIMDNGEASKQKPIGDNYEEGEMHGSDQNKKDIEEELSDAIFSLDYEKVKSLVEQLKQGNDNTEQIIREALKKANEKEVGRKDKASKNKLTEIKRFLAEELKSIGGAAPSVDDSAATGSQATPAAELKESEEDQPDSPSSKSSVGGSNGSASSFVKLPESDTENGNGEYVKVSPLPVSGSGSSFEDIESVPTSGRNSPQATTSDSSDKEASQPVEPEVSNPQAEENTAPLKTPEKSEGQELASVAQNTETENDILSIQPTAPESTDKEQAAEQTPLQVEGKSEFEGKRDSPSPESSASGGSSSSSFVNVSTSDGGVTDSSNGKCVKVEDIVEDTVLKDTGSPQDIQPGISTSKPSGTGAEGDATVSSAKGGKKKQTPVQPAKDIAQIDDDDDYDLSWLFSEEGDQVPHPENLEPEPMLSSTSKKSEQVNNTTPQNTESSNLHIIAASALAIVGVALGVAIAVHLEMLAVGILVGACCLVAAAVIYCCSPQSSVKDSEIEKVPSKEKEPVSV